MSARRRLYFRRLLSAPQTRPEVALGLPNILGLLRDIRRGPSTTKLKILIEIEVARRLSILDGESGERLPVLVELRHSSQINGGDRDPRFDPQKTQILTMPPSIPERCG